MKHQPLITYFDCWDNETELTETEVNWFYSEAKKAKKITGINVDIIPYNHELYSGKSKDALGCCITQDPKNQLGPGVDTYITIDCYFINEAFNAEFNGGWLISGQTLQEVIAHELAHLTIWRHGKKHSALTQEYLARILAA